MSERKTEFYGLYDVRDGCWLGSEKGNAPFREPDYDKARLIATIASERLGRLVRARILTDAQFTYKDTVTPDISGEEAIRRIEGKA